MSKPILAVDVDETLAHLVDALNRRYLSPSGKRLLHSDFAEYNFEHAWKMERADVFDRLAEFFNRYSDDIHPIEGSKEALERLHDKYDLIITTARPKGADEATRQWIHHHYPRLFTDIYFTHADNFTHHKDVSKAQICQELDVHRLVDDLVHTWDHYDQAGIEVLLFGDYPWNQKNVPAHVQRVTNWSEVTQVLL